MDTFFINLDARPDRRLFMEEQLASLGLQAERFPAVATPTVSPRGRLPRSKKGRAPLLRPELACLESHLALWQYVLANNRPAVILEDDAVLSSRLPAFLAQLGSTLPPGIEVVRLETWFESVRLGRAVEIGAFTLRHQVYGQCGSAAYIISPSAARKLIACSHLTLLSVDEIVFQPPALFELSVWQAVPALAAQLDRLSPQAAASTSDIQASRSAGTNHRSKWLIRLEYAWWLFTKCHPADWSYCQQRVTVPFEQ